MIVKVLVGLPGAGKSTLAKKWVNEDSPARERINFDDIRLELYGPNWIFNFEEEKVVKTVARDRAEIALTAGKSLIIDNTNLVAAKYEVWRQMALTFKADFEVQHIDTPTHICVDQDRLRKGVGRVGRAVIEGMALRYGMINWNDTTLYDPDSRFVIVDVDGTIADLSHRRPLLDTKCLNCGYVNPPRSKDGKCGQGLLDPTKALKSGGLCGGEVTKKMWERFFTTANLDPPIEKMCRLVRDLNEIGYIILVVSGRPEDRCGLITEQWLTNHGIPHEHLFMRKGGDRRDDDLVKKEILSFLPKDRIAFVLDDRDRVVQMWRENGLTCLQVAPGDF